MTTTDQLTTCLEVFDRATAWVVAHPALAVGVATFVVLVYTLWQACRSAKGAPRA